MVEVAFGIILRELYQSFLATLPNWAQNFINLFLIVLVIMFYSIFIWKLYRYLAKKDLFEMNLHKKRSMGKLSEKIIYAFEYVFLVPIMVFVWFAIFTLLLMFLTENLEIGKLLIISATVIAAIRMAAYYKEDLAKDLGKLLPFTLLGVAITQSTALGFSQAISHISQIPQFFSEIIIYLAFIIILEFVLRIFDWTFASPEKVEEVVED